MGNQIYISQLIKSFILHRLFFEVKKFDVRLNEILILKFILFCFDSVYQTRPSDTITQQWKYDYANGLGSFFATLYYTLYQQKPGSKMPCILHFRIEYSLKFVSTNPIFYPVLPTPRFKQLLLGGSYSKNPKKLICRLI